jgi:hypothetical protein
MVKDVETQKLHSKMHKSTWPSFVKKIKIFPGKKDTSKDLLNILERLYENKTAKG